MSKKREKYYLQQSDKKSIRIIPHMTTNYSTFALLKDLSGHVKDILRTYLEHGRDTLGTSKGHVRGL